MNDNPFGMTDEQTRAFVAALRRRTGDDAPPDFVDADYAAPPRDGYAAEDAKALDDLASLERLFDAPPLPARRLAELGREAAEALSRGAPKAWRQGDPTSPGPARISLDAREVAALAKAAGRLERLLPIVEQTRRALQESRSIAEQGAARMGRAETDLADARDALLWRQRCDEAYVSGQLSRSIGADVTQNPYYTLPEDHPDRQLHFPWTMGWNAAHERALLGAVYVGAVRLTGAHSSAAPESLFDADGPGFDLRRAVVAALPFLDPAKE